MSKGKVPGKRVYVRGTALCACERKRLQKVMHKGSLPSCLHNSPPSCVCVSVFMCACVCVHVCVCVCKQGVMHEGAFQAACTQHQPCHSH